MRCQPFTFTDAIFGLLFKLVCSIRGINIYELNGLCDLIQCTPDDVTDTKNQTSPDQPLTSPDQPDLIFSGFPPEAHPIDPCVCLKKTDQLRSCF